MVKDIILISPKFSECIGGMETHGVEFVKHFYNNEKFNLKSILVNSDIKDGVKIKNYTENEKYKNIIKRILTENNELDSKFILKEIKNEDSILFLNSPTWLPILPKIKKEYPKLKVVLRSGGNDIIAGWIGNENEMDKPLEESRKEVVNLINEHVNLIILNSEYTKKRCLSVGVKSSKTIVLKGGVDISKFSKKNLNNKKIKILTTGRFVKFKGLEYSLKAIANLKEKIGEKFEYIIVGDGPEKERLAKLLIELNLVNIVKIEEAVAFNKVHEFYNKSDIFLHMPIELEKKERGSSYIHTETMGRSICEALSSGLPVITTNVGGVPEMIKDEHNAFLVNSKDYISASEKLYQLVTNNPLRNEMSNNARNAAESKFDWKILFRKYEEVFENEN